MTEKRFEIDSKMYGATDIKYWLKDNDGELVDGYGDEIYWGDGSTNGLKQIVNKLNELHDENKELKKENDALKKFVKCIKIWSDLNGSRFILGR